jgi:Ser/Thr protein kinase RdoA (MazF antagonist)
MHSPPAVDADILATATVAGPAMLLLLQYVGEEDPLSLITNFVAGYSQHGQLSTTEMEILPDLINLRIFSNVIYFTGR